MDLNYIHEFVVLSQVMQFQEAAEVLFISQSSLSKHIKAMETELGHELFVRSKRSIQLTDFGKVFLPYASQIANIQQEYTTELLEKDLTVKTIVIGYIPMVTLYTFMNFFSVFAKKHPEYQYNFMQGNKKQLLNWLQQKRVDFILTDQIDLPDSEAYRQCLYTSDSLVAILPARHPLAVKEHVTIEDLRDEVFIQFSDNDTLLRNANKSNAELHLNTAFHIDREPVLLQLIQKELGFSILTKHMAEHFQTEGTIIKPIVPKSNVDILMIYSAKPRPSLATRMFIQYLEERSRK